MLARQLTEAEFHKAYVMLFEGGRSLRECVVHVRGLDQRSLKKAYRRRAQETHPDRAHLRPSRGKDPDAEFRAVVAAYELLRLVQQGDVEVAIAVVRDGSSRPAQTARPDRPAARPGRPASRPRPAPETDRARARKARREHRQDQPFTARERYTRWQGRASQTRTEGPGDRAKAQSSAQQPVRDRSQSAAKFPLPERTLQLGQFLYYSGAISWRQLIDALVWQRRQRPLIGQLALAWGLMTREQVADVLSHRRETGRYDVPFAEYAMQCGYLTPSQQRSLIGRAQLMQQRLGRFFVEQGILTELQLNHYLKAMRLHNWRVRRRAQANGY